MRTAIKLLLGSVVLIALALLGWWALRQQPALPLAETAIVPPPEAKRENTLAAITPQVVETTPTVPLTVAPSGTALVVPAQDGPIIAPAAQVPAKGPHPEETAATSRMIAAHAPLRGREVADPDSASNKLILQAMVTKVLQRSAEPAGAGR